MLEKSAMKKTSKARLVEDYHTQAVYKIELLSQRYELIREYHSRFLKLEPHKRLCGIVLPCIEVKNRLTIHKHAAVERILLRNDILKLAEDVVLVVIFLYIVLTMVLFSSLWSL